MITFSDGWREAQIHEEMMKTLSLKNEAVVLEMMKPRLEIIDDGYNCNCGEWPCIIEGIGNTPAEAVSNFVKSYFTNRVSKQLQKMIFEKSQQ